MRLSILYAEYKAASKHISPNFYKYYTKQGIFTSLNKMKRERRCEDRLYCYY